MKRSIMRDTAAGLAVVGLLILGLGWVSHRNTKAFIEASQAVVHTRLVLGELLSVRSDLGRADSSIRGYVISGAPLYLRGYDRAIGRLRTSVNRLQELTLDNPTQQARLMELRLKVAERLKTLEHILEIYREHGLPAVQAYFGDAESRVTLQDVTDTINLIRAEEEKLLDDRSVSLQARARDTNITQLLVIAMELALLALVYLSFSHYHNERLRNFELMQMQKHELEVRNREVERANRLKSQFLANMSHELRTPMNAILGFSELLEEDTSSQLNPKQLRWTQHIRTAGQHLLQLINDILDLSKIEAGRLEIRPEDFMVSSTLPEVLSIVSPIAAARNIKISTAVPEQLTIHADRVRFKQVLYNLLSNAVKFTPENGSVRVDCTAQESTAIISVSDTGIGITKDDQAIIFDDFRQAPAGSNSSKEGSGLGLAICRRLVQLQGGQIWVDSEPGKGSRFTFTAVLGAKSAVREVPGSKPAASLERSQTRSRPLVLVVDDELATQELLRGFLQSDSYEVITATSAWEAVTIAREQHPDAITLDILMPGGTGWEALHQLKSDSTTAQIPIIVVSVVDHRELGFTLGASDYLVKPVNKERLLAALRRHGGMNAGGGRIVLVDDQPEDLRNMVEAVQAGGYLPVTARNGTEALHCIQQEQPRAVILDLIMPEMDGFQTLQRLRQIPGCESLPVLVLTAKELSPEESELLLRSAHSWFRKGPGWKSELLERIRAAVGDEREKSVAVV